MTHAQSSEPSQPLDDALSQVERAERELQRLQTSFVEMAGHEFRTPLTIIDSAARRLDRKAEEVQPDVIREKAAMIRETVLRVVELVERTFELAEITTARFAIRPASCQIKALVASVCSAQSERTSDVQIEVDTHDGPDAVIGDPRYIELILENLVRGGARLVSGVGRLDVSSWRDGEEIAINIKCLSEASASNPLDNIEARVDEFMSRNRLLDEGIEFKLAKNMIELHRGEIDFCGETGRCLEIDVRLPLNVIEAAA